MNQIKNLLIVLMFFLSQFSFSISPNKETLSQKYSDYFPVGTCLSAGEFGSNSIKNTDTELLNQYNLFVAENSMKPELLRTDNRGWNWNYADSFIKYTRSRGVKVRGHVLVWHQMTPWWMTAGGKSEAKKVLTDHINKLVKRYKNDIYCWDVVNEGVSDVYGYRKDSPWYKAYGGPEYIGDAFIAARNADPDCLLFYNDYNLTMPNKRSMVKKMIRDLDLINKGLDGIGIQAHWSLNWPSISAIEKTINTFYEMGLLVEITELDITCYSPIRENEKEKKYDSKLEDKLAKRYKEIFELFRKNAEKINSVTMWGISDNESWLNHFRGFNFYNEVRANYPLIFDKDQKPKKAYKEIMDF